MLSNDPNSHLYDPKYNPDRPNDAYAYDDPDKIKESIRRYFTEPSQDALDQWNRPGQTPISPWNAPLPNRIYDADGNDLRPPDTGFLQFPEEPLPAGGYSILGQPLGNSPMDSMLYNDGNNGQAVDANVANTERKGIQPQGALMAIVQRYGQSNLPWMQLLMGQR